MDKFCLYTWELMERIIRVEFAKSFNKPSPPQPGAPKAEGRYKIYASNLAWKVRSTNLKNLFSEKFKPVSARVVFDSASGKSAGYGFVGFATMVEAEAVVSELDGKELLGRPFHLKISQSRVMHLEKKQKIWMILNNNLRCLECNCLLPLHVFLPRRGQRVQYVLMYNVQLGWSTPEQIRESSRSYMWIMLRSFSSGL